MFFSYVLNDFADLDNFPFLFKRKADTYKLHKRNVQIMEKSEKMHTTLKETGRQRTRSGMVWKGQLVG